MTVFYRVLYYIWRVIFSQTMRTCSINAVELRRPGGFVLAVSHLSHLEVVVVGVMTPRQIHWIARKEFYTGRLMRGLLQTLGCIKVNRQGVSVSAIRAAVSVAREGKIVGIFPEGGVVKGNGLAMRGGPLKRGMCSIAIRAGVPIIPCVILGTEKLNAVGPWLPMWRGKLWVGVGEPVCPPQRSTRLSRMRMADDVRQQMQRLYADLQQRFGVRDENVP